jgi:hypothetical protein
MISPSVLSSPLWMLRNSVVRKPTTSCILLPIISRAYRSMVANTDTSIITTITDDNNNDKNVIASYDNHNDVIVASSHVPLSRHYSFFRHQRSNLCYRVTLIKTLTTLNHNNRNISSGRYNSNSATSQLSPIITMTSASPESGTSSKNGDTDHGTKDNSSSSSTSCGTVEDDDEMEQEEMFVEPYETFEYQNIREWNGPRRGGRLPEPTRYGDWERKGRCTDF